MNKVSLLTVGKKLQDGNLYLISVHDLEPAGLIVHAYDQINSKEYILPITEFQLVAARYNRTRESLQSLLDTVDIVPQGNDLILVSSNEAIPSAKARLLGGELEGLLKQPLVAGQGPSLNELIVTGLLELSKAKPVGIEAVRWLGEWFLANNPVKPNVVPPDDE